MIPRAWKSTLYRHGILLVLGAFVGWIYGHVLAGMLVVLLAMLGWHLLNLYRLDQWLRTGRIAADRLDPGFLAKCQEQIAAAMCCNHAHPIRSRWSLPP